MLLDWWICVRSYARRRCLLAWLDLVVANDRQGQFLGERESAHTEGGDSDALEQFKDGAFFNAFAQGRPSPVKRFHELTYRTSAAGAQARKLSRPIRTKLDRLDKVQQ